MSEIISPVERLAPKFEPFMEPFVRPRVAAEMNDGLPIRKKMRFLSYFFREAGVRIGLDMLKALFTKFSPEEIEKETKEAVALDARTLTCAWLMTLTLTRRKYPTLGALLADLDEAMLPPLEPGCLKAWNGTNLFFLDMTEAITVLRAMRRSLPDGQVLPEEAIEYLTYDEAE